MFKFNDVVKTEVLQQTNPSGGHAVRVTLACGQSGTEWTQQDAQQVAELEWYNNQHNQFVIRNGVPRHIEIAGLTDDEVRERVPNADI
jgi:hypothetical protein